MHQPWDDHLGAARPTTDRVARFEHRDGEPGARQPGGGGEPVWPAADDDRGGHSVMVAG